MSSKPLQLALLGAGGFAADAWLPALEQAGGSVLVKAVWSRSEPRALGAQEGIRSFSPACRAFHGADGLQELLASPGVDAVLVVLPPQAQGAVVQAALRAGKHVLSEKPAAPTLSEAEQLLAFHRSLPATAAAPPPLWAVAENYRSMPAFLQLRDAVASGALGTLLRLDMAVDLALAPGSKYYDSAWRRDAASMPGAGGAGPMHPCTASAYLLEGGVHFVAALRMAARAAGWGEASAVSAAARGVAADLPHPDTLTGLLFFDSGAAATFSMTCGASAMRVALRAVGAAGWAQAERGGGGQGGKAFRLTVQGEGQVEAEGSGIQEELLSFARLAGAASATPAAGAPPTSLTLTPAEAGAAAATDGSDPERDAVGAAPAAAAAAGSSAGAGEGVAAAPAPPGAAEEEQGPVAVEEGGGKARLKDLPSDEDAWRISCVEACRDVAVVTALLESARRGGEKTAVAPF